MIKKIKIVVLSLVSRIKKKPNLIIFVKIGDVFSTKGIFVGYPVYKRKNAWL